MVKVLIANLIAIYVCYIAYKLLSKTYEKKSKLFRIISYIALFLVSTILAFVLISLKDVSNIDAFGFYNLTFFPILGTIAIIISLIFKFIEKKK